MLTGPFFIILQTVKYVIKFGVIAVVWKRRKMHKEREQ